MNEKPSPSRDRRLFRRPATVAQVRDPRGAYVIIEASTTDHKHAELSEAIAVPIEEVDALITQLTEAKRVLL